MFLENAEAQLVAGVAVYLIHAATAEPGPDSCVHPPSSGCLALYCPERLHPALLVLASRLPSPLLPRGLDPLHRLSGRPPLICSTLLSRLAGPPPVACLAPASIPSLLPALHHVGEVHCGNMFLYL